jgi:hypothetical protein
VRYKLERLDSHMKTSHALLNDLRTLKRLLVGEGQRSAGRPDERLRQQDLQDISESAAGRLKALRRVAIP